MSSEEPQDQRVPVTLTEATYDETGVHIRGTIPMDQAVRLGLTGGEANASGFSLINRWAAFTDDELAQLDAAKDFVGLLWREVKSEIERRRSPS